MGQTLDLEVARLISERIAARGLSGRQLAEATGIPVPTMARRLNVGGFTVSELDRVSATLGVKAATLVASAQRRLAA